jgi:hypothetical protein
MTTATTNFTAIGPEVANLLERAGAGTWTVSAGDSRAKLTRESDGMVLDLSEAGLSKPSLEATVNWDRDIVITEIPYREVDIQTKLNSYLYEYETKDVKLYVRGGVKAGAKGLASAIVMDLLPRVTPLYLKALERHATAKRLLAAAGGDSKLRAYGYSIANVDLQYGPTTSIYGDARVYLDDTVEVKLSGLTEDQAAKVLALVAELSKEKTREPKEGE